MEALRFQMKSKASGPKAAPVSTLSGVVSSGNLEVLIEAHKDQETCQVSIQTAAEGFGEIWQSVLEEFARAHAAGGLSLSINDVGATPAVVSLRLRQALETWEAA